MAHKNHFIVTLLISFAVLCSVAANTEANEGVLQIPRELNPTLDKLLDLTDQNDHSRPDMDAIGRVVDYISTPKDLSATYSAGQRKGATSNYFEFTIERSLEDVISLAYNPDIPSYFIIPASLHQSRWLEKDGKPQSLPDLSNALTSLSEPVFFKGLEFVENTPDTHSGAYYSYELNRAVILARYQGRPVLLSMSSQRGKSDVGKKGLVVGKDDDWNYLYTGEKGCTKKGLGWVDSYMYNSESIMVYYETSEPAPQVRCAVFKWVHAGWAGINMAQPFHIKKGIERFAKTFKQVVESTTLPESTELAATIRRINDLPIHELRKKVRDHFNTLRAHHQNDSKLNRKWFARLFADGHYVEEMNQEELKAVVCKEYLKYLLGKAHGFDLALFNRNKNRSKNPG